MQNGTGAPPVYKPQQTVPRVAMAKVPVRYTASPLPKLPAETRPAPPVFRPSAAPVRPAVMQPAARPGNPRPTAVQPYKILPSAKRSLKFYGLGYDLRVSNDGKMAVRDTGNWTPTGTNNYQDLYLAPDVFKASQQALANTNSGVTLTQTATTIRGKPPGGDQIRTLHKITIQYSDTPNNAAYSACNANAYNVVGTLRNAQPVGGVAAHGYFKSHVGASRWVPSQQPDRAYTEVRNEITGQVQDQSRQDWQGLSASERKLAARKFGINQYAKPKAGEAIGVYQAGLGGTVAMGHMAGVLARSGGDYVTIETYAGNPGSVAHGGTMVNSNWYVRMFGSKKGQSFYEFHKINESAEYGTEPIAVRLRAH